MQQGCLGWMLPRGFPNGHETLPFSSPGMGGQPLWEVGEPFLSVPSSSQAAVTLRPPHPQPASSLCDSRSLLMGRWARGASQPWMHWQSVAACWILPRMALGSCFHISSACLTLMDDLLIASLEKMLCLIFDKCYKEGLMVSGQPLLLLLLFRIWDFSQKAC